MIEAKPLCQDDHQAEHKKVEEHELIKPRVWAEFEPLHSLIGGMRTFRSISIEEALGIQALAEAHLFLQR